MDECTSVDVIDVYIIYPMKMEVFVYVGGGENIPFSIHLKKVGGLFICTDITS